MKAIILAAGIGSRLKPITDKIPKTLVKISNKSILAYQIESLLKNNIEKIIICVGYKSKLIINFCKKNYPNANFKFILNKKYRNTNNMYSLYLVREFLNEDIFLMNGDVVFDQEIISSMMKEKNSLIAVDTGKYLKESMKIKVGNDRFVSDISKIITEKESYGCSIDVYKFTKDDLEVIKRELSRIIEKEKEKNLWTEILLQRLFNSKEIKAKPLDIKNNKWWEIDDFSDLNEAEKLFNKNLKKIVKKKLFLVDGDGTLILGNKKIDGSDEFLNVLKKRKKHFCILTNNSSKTKKEHFQKYKLLGFNIKEENIVFSTDSLINYLLGNEIKDIYLLANKEVSRYFISRGFKIDFKNSKAVVLTYDTEINYKKLVEATLLIKKGLPYFATHIDNLCPTEKGFVPDIGTFIKVLEMSTGRTPDKTFGKPSENLILPVLRKYNLRPKDCVLVGDRIYTDIKMANDLGMLSVLVLSGETKREDVEFSDICPNIIIKDIGELESFL